MNNLVQINFNGETVITTKMLAQVYEAEVIQLQQNFKYNEINLLLYYKIHKNITYLKVYPKLYLNFAIGTLKTRELCHGFNLRNNRRMMQFTCSGSDPSLRKHIPESFLRLLCR